jgi:OOP family OmpA-OmpF porin
MFTAIQDFVQESFSPDRSGRLETADMGEFTLWAVHGPHALLVCVIRGVPPRRLRGDLSAILERIHFRYGESLREYAGDTSSMQSVESELKECLGFEALKPAETGKRRMSLPLLIILLILVAGLVYLGFSAFESARQERALASALAAAPGYYVDGVDAEGRNFVVRGLRDPLAESLESVAARAGLTPGRVSGDLRPYQSLDPDIVVQRARAVIDAPGGVDVQLNGGRIVVSGSAPEAWVDSLRNNAALRLLGLPLELGELTAPADSAPEPADPLAALRARARELDRAAYLFAAGADLREDDALRLTEHAIAVRELAAAAALAGARLRIDVIGQTDASGSLATNRRLAERRAETAARVLADQGLDPELIRRSHDVPATAGGAPEPGLRRVTILVALEPPASPASPDDE